jgi:glycerol-3-phosphate O-acyltransferase / dihydroxyacetone phosphate acyltransferase
LDDDDDDDDDMNQNHHNHHNYHIKHYHDINNEEVDQDDDDEMIQFPIIREIKNSSPTSDNEEKKEEDSVKDAVVTSTVVEELVDNVIHVIGVNTRFIRELKPGDKIRLLGTAYALRVRSIESETCMTIDGNELPHDSPTTIFHQDKGVPFDLLKRTPLVKVFEKVLDRLAAGGAVGIFPEGGSHDRTDLLPLKVGISLIAYSALEKDGIVVPVVPIGLNSFRAHRWRGRVVVEYG